MQLPPDPYPSSWNVWMQAMRPRTLSISLVPVLIATAFAQRTSHPAPLWIACCCALFAFFVQIATNLLNDAYDARRGVDGAARLGPKRATQTGWLSFEQVRGMGLLALLCALGAGIPLLVLGGWPLAPIAILSILCAYLYSAGPYPLSDLGISDLFVLLFFGWVATGTTYYLQTDRIDLPILIAATQVGLLAVVPHAINNLRDYHTDFEADKRTLAVRLGPLFVKREILLLSILPFVLNLFWFMQGSFLMGALPWILFPATLRNLFLLWNLSPSHQHNALLASSAQIQLLFALLLILGMQWS